MIVVHAYVEVSDLRRGIDFYCGGLGLTLGRRLSPTWAELGGANLPVFLLGGRPPMADLGGGKRASRTYERHWTPVHLDFVVSGLDGAVARLVGLGASLDRPVGAREYGRIANMADPFGNGFDLVEFSGDGYEAVARGAPDGGPVAAGGG